MIEDWEYPDTFQPGDKVWFFGKKAKVVEGFDQAREFWPGWAVPIAFNDGEFVTVAHAGDLKRRGKKK